jgi:HEAT repeat protein
MTCATSRSLETSLAKLKSLHSGDIGLIEVTSFGVGAIPPLRELLFERDPSGLYHTRCRAVDALAALQAYEVLLDFLATAREIVDPVERVGEDAVINAAARALGHARDERAFQVLLVLARTRTLAGVIAALGAFKRHEAIPYLVAALEEDDCRLTAERALRNFGRTAQPALRGAALARSPSVGMESISSQRRRRSARILLSEMKRSAMSTLR